MKLSKRIFCLLMVFCYNPAHAQIFVQTFAGHTGIEFNTILERGVSSDHKLNYFGYSYFYVDYLNKTDNAYEIYQVLNYELINNSGVSLGGSFSENEFIPQVGFYWHFEKNFIELDIIPAVDYSFGSGGISYSIFGFILHRKPIKNEWNLYNQLIFASNFDFSESHVSYQQLRIGLEYKNSLQFGIGVNFEEYDTDFVLNYNLGLFLSKEL